MLWTIELKFCKQNRKSHGFHLSLKLVKEFERVKIVGCKKTKSTNLLICSVPWKILKIEISVMNFYILLQNGWGIYELPGANFLSDMKTILKGHLSPTPPPCIDVAFLWLLSEEHIELICLTSIAREGKGRKVTRTTFDLMTQFTFRKNDCLYIFCSWLWLLNK